jgi:hypothetical protein
MRGMREREDGTSRSATRVEQAPSCSGLQPSCGYAYLRVARRNRDDGAGVPCTLARSMQSLAWRVGESRDCSSGELVRGSSSSSKGGVVVRSGI